MNIIKRIKNFCSDFISTMGILSINRKTLYKSEFDPDRWAFLNNLVILSSNDMFLLDSRLNYYLETGNTNKNSILHFIAVRTRGLRRPEESTQDMVVRMVKYDFEKQFGISFVEFVETYKNIEKSNPERLI